eukprot:TRINITY_DN12523_c0_g1_i1.p4 TRINITY_DN12523_c0_g1~~TRINITY_DN12523_c0_g1_i1.p4  ORF type:complete len:102 (+),score=11.93 TRINITY_DN12523_c0_g1_i1:3-308(+)
MLVLAHCSLGQHPLARIGNKRYSGDREWVCTFPATVLASSSFATGHPYSNGALCCFASGARHPHRCTDNPPLHLPICVVVEPAVDGVYTLTVICRTSDSEA